MCTPARAMSITTPLEVDLAVVTISPTKELQSRWPHKLQNNYTKEILTLLKSSRTPHRLPNLVIWQRDWEPPGNLILEASGIWLKNLNRTGKQTLRGHKQNLVHIRSQEKGTVSPQETEPDLPVSVRESPAEVWVNSGLLQGQGHWIQQCMHKSFWRIIFITPIQQPHPSTENWIKDLLNMTPPIRTRPSFPQSQSLPSGSFHKPLILIH